MIKKHNAFGILELLIVIIIAIVVYFSFFHSNYGRKNPFDDNAGIKTQQQAVDSKIQEIEDYKKLRQDIEKNLQKGY